MGKTNVIERPVTEEATAVVEGPICQHHWVIDTPRGSMSEGRCKRCGEQREFKNSTEYVWDNDSGGGGSPWRGIRATPTRSTADDAEMGSSSRGTKGIAV
jgi:hypothetical protein